MPKIAISAFKLKKQVEQKAYAYGTPPAVAALLGEYVIDILREATQQHSSFTLTSHSYGNEQLV